MTKTIAIFIGNLTNTNVQNLISNQAWMLGSSFNLDLITTNPGEFSVEEYSRVVGGGYPNTWRGATKALRDYIRQVRPDVLMHTNRPQIHGNIVALLGKYKDTTTVYRYGGDTFYLHQVAEGWKKIPYFAINNIVGRAPVYLSDEQIVLGPHGRDQLAARGAAKENITILPPAIDTKRFQKEESADLSIPDDRDIVLFLGRRTNLKGIQTVESKLPEILRRRNDLQFVFVGKGRDLEIEQRWQDHVTIVGQVDPSDVSKYLHAADVLMHPSLTEGVPRVLLEALATRTPVIARDVGEISTVTENIFTSDDEFVDMVCKYEQLVLDPIEPFDRDTLKNSYIEYFDQI